MTPDAFTKSVGTIACGVCEGFNRFGAVVSAIAHGATGLGNTVLYPLSEIGSLMMRAPGAAIWGMGFFLVCAVSLALDSGKPIEAYLSKPTTVDMETVDVPSSETVENSFFERAKRHFEAAKDLLTYATTGDNQALDNARKNTMLGNSIESILKSSNTSEKSEHTGPGLG